MSDTVRKKGAAATEGNKRRYAALIADMKATGKKFPCNQFGDPSIGWVANKVVCTRDVLRNGSLAEQFALDVSNIGVEAGESDVANANLQKKAEDKNRENSALRSSLSEKIAEVEALRMQIEHLSKHVRELELRDLQEDFVIHELLKGGRRFYL